MPHLVVMAAGTGGHIIPGLAVAREMQQRGWTVSWLGTAHGMENQLVPKSGIALDTITFSGVSGINLTALLPQITSQVTINGASVGGTPGVTLNGGGSQTIGLQLAAGSDNSVVRGLVLQNFTATRLVGVVQGAAIVTMLLNTIALWKQEARQPRRSANGQPARAEAAPTRRCAAAAWSRPPAR